MQAATIISLIALAIATIAMLGTVANALNANWVARRDRPSLAIYTFQGTGSDYVKGRISLLLQSEVLIIIVKNTGRRRIGIAPVNAVKLLLADGAELELAEQQDEDASDPFKEHARYFERRSDNMLDEQERFVVLFNRAFWQLELLGARPHCTGVVVRDNAGRRYVHKFGPDLRKWLNATPPIKLQD